MPRDVVAPDVADSGSAETPGVPSVRRRRFGGGAMNPVLEPLFQAAFATMDLAEQDRIMARIHTRVVDEALFLFVAHDLNPRAMSRRVKGFVQARNWSQDLTPISLQ